MVSASRSGSGRQSSTVHCISDPKIATRSMGKNRGGKVDTYMSKDWLWVLLIDIAKARRIGNCIRLSVYGKPAEGGLQSLILGIKASSPAWLPVMIVHRRTLFLISVRTSRVSLQRPDDGERLRRRMIGHPTFKDRSVITNVQ